MTDSKARTLMIILAIVLIILLALIAYLMTLPSYITAEASRATMGAEQFFLQLTAMAAGK